LQSSCASLMKCQLSDQVFLSLISGIGFCRYFLMAIK
jgi:hypothetical protein